jgi:phosphatidylglycerophosphate synthase
MNLFQDYIKSLKLPEVEEIVDLFIYRPLGLIVVKLVYRTSITPNQLTWMAMLMGLLGSIAFSYGTRSGYLFGAILLILYDVFDCSDGQLARMKKNGTLTGRIVDGVSDYVVATFTYLGIGFGFAGHSDDPLFYWFLTVLAGFSNALHAFAVDYYRNQFLDYALDRKGILDEDLNQFEAEYGRLVAQNKWSFDRVIIWIYLKYSRLQMNFSAEDTSKNNKKYDPKDYYQKNKRILHFWTYIGPSSDLTVVIVCALLNRWDIFFFWIIAVLNVYTLILFLTQKRINTTIRLETSS